jgi:hypothetical protein
MKTAKVSSNGTYNKINKRAEITDTKQTSTNKQDVTSTRNANSFLASNKLHVQFMTTAIRNRLTGSIKLSLGTDVITGDPTSRQRRLPTDTRH